MYRAFFVGILCFYGDGITLMPFSIMKSLLKNDSLKSIFDAFYACSVIPSSNVFFSYVEKNAGWRRELKKYLSSCTESL